MNINDFNLWTALVTPFTPGLQVDWESLAALIKEQEDAGNGLLILGSTGEALNIDLDTKKRIVDFALVHRKNSPIMIGVGGHELKAQLDWTRWLEAKNIDAYLMVTPLYAKPGDHGQYQWFKALMDSVTKPVMLYNVPGRTAKELSFSTVTRLKNHPNFWSIKEASGSVAKMKQYLAACDHGKVYCGDDGLMSDFANAGACGLISVAANTWPKATNLYVKKCLDKTLKEAAMWNESANSLFVASNPVPAKALLAAEGRIKHQTMLPPLAEEDLRDLSPLTRANTNINNWFENNSHSK